MFAFVVYGYGTLVLLKHVFRWCHVQKLFRDFRCFHIVDQKTVVWKVDKLMGDSAIFKLQSCSICSFAWNSDWSINTATPMPRMRMTRETHDIVHFLTSYSMQQICLLEANWTRKWKNEAVHCSYHNQSFKLQSW